MTTLSGSFPNSSNLASYSYNSDDGTLVIAFHHGGSYAYSGVPQQMVRDLIGAESAGKFFHANIRNAYTTTKL